MTRVYLPVGIDGLRRLHAVGRLDPGLEGYAPTDRVREHLEGLESEELEYALATAAAEVVPDRSGVSSTATRRVVLAVDIDDQAIREDAHIPGSVTVTAALEHRQVAAVLVGPDPAADRVDTAASADSDLAWFATQEIADLLA